MVSVCHLDLVSTFAFFFFFFFANENNLNMLRCDEIEKFAGVLRSRPTSDRHDWRSLSCSFVVQWTENMMMIMMSRLAEQCKMSGDTAPCSRCHPRTVLERILCVETDSGRQSSGCNCFDATAAEIWISHFFVRKALQDSLLLYLLRSDAIHLI